MTSPMFDLAIRIRDDLRVLPEAIRVEIAGSLRRENPNPHDVEICALVTPQEDLFGTDPNRPSPVLRDYLISRSERVVKGGAKMLQVVIDGTNVDYFQTADPARWGVLFFIRTGPAHYVKNALTEWKRMNHWKGFSKGNILFRDYKQPVATPSEEDVFRVLGWQFQQPKQRI